MTNKNPELVTPLIQEVVDNTVFEYQLFLRFHHITTRVFINVTKVYHELADYFREFICSETETAIDLHVVHAPDATYDFDFTIKQPEAGKIKIKEEYVNCTDGRIVRKRLTGMYFLFNGQQNLVIGPVLDNINQVVNFINNRFIQRILNTGTTLLFHSSAVSYKGKGVAISGFSGMGKSTLALHLMNDGLDFVSNDRVLVDKQSGGQLYMYGVAKYPRINPGTIVNNERLKNMLPEDEIRRLQQLPIDKLWELEDKYDGFIDEIYGDDKFTIMAEMKALVILNWHRNQTECSIKEIQLDQHPDLFPAFMKSPGLFYLPFGEKKPDLSSENYRNYLRHCRVFEISGGVDFEKAAAFFTPLIKNRIQA